MWHLPTVETSIAVLLRIVVVGAGVSAIVLLIVAPSLWALATLIVAALVGAAEARAIVTSRRRPQSSDSGHLYRGLNRIISALDDGEILRAPTTVFVVRRTRVLGLLEHRELERVNLTGAETLLVGRRYILADKPHVKRQFFAARRRVNHPQGYTATTPLLPRRRWRDGIAYVRWQHRTSVWHADPDELRALIIELQHAAVWQPPTHCPHPPFDEHNDTDEP